MTDFMLVVSRVMCKSPTRFEENGHLERRVRNAVVTLKKGEAT